MPALHRSQQEGRSCVRPADTRKYELAIRGSAPSFQHDIRAAGGQHTRYLDDRTNCRHGESSPSLSTAGPIRSGQPKRPNKEGFSGTKPVSCAPLTPSVSQSRLVNGVTGKFPISSPAPGPNPSDGLSPNLTYVGDCRWTASALNSKSPYTAAAKPMAQPGIEAQRRALRPGRQ